ncbi:hypothetical protein L596_000489 [Steinernema carpocapsae]|uniref:Uncharacterized protein n=1 Tax=Steinernema carpocapsae TaxID=34508 RepID=A0A4U8UI81_STECR|nr:hypothetical protein L596_000489 [Steinernema carpocapsae]
MLYRYKTMSSLDFSNIALIEDPFKTSGPNSFVTSTPYPVRSRFIDSPNPRIRSRKISGPRSYKSRIQEEIENDAEELERLINMQMSVRANDRQMHPLLQKHMALFFLAPIVLLVFLFFVTPESIYSALESMFSAYFIALVMYLSEFEL